MQLNFVNKKDNNEISLLDILSRLDQNNKENLTEQIDRIVKELTDVKRKTIQEIEAEKAKREQEEQKQREIEAQKKEDEHIKEVTSMDLPLDWDNSFCSDDRTKGIHVDNIPDALILSLTTLGRVDIEYISAITNEEYKTVIKTLKGSIYQNPNKWDECFYKGWETAEEYLSGNLFVKLQDASIANKKYKGYFQENIRALKEAMPKPISSNDIYVSLGSPWLPSDIIDDFMIHLFGHVNSNYYPESYWKNKLKTIHDEITGTWYIPEKNRYMHKVAVCRTYGTDRMEALHILEKTLNMKTLAVMDEIPCAINKSGKKKVINQSETIAVIEKQEQLVKAFEKWIWKDQERKERLEKLYAEKFCSTKIRHFDGSFLTFPGLSPNVHLYPYQKNAVARIIFTPNTLLAHDVGAGKTYEMIAAGQELRRMGLSKKNMFVVPNNIVGQWRNIFLNMYPKANLLCIEPKDFTPNKRDGVLRQIKDLDYDGIIIAYSCFELINVSKTCLIQGLQEELDKFLEIVNNKDIPNSYMLENKVANIKKEIEELEKSVDINTTPCFDELGINRLFLDEAHNYKNIPIDTKSTNVLGINATGSNKCKEMLDKVHVVQKQNDGKGVIFATGTPITNSVTDAFTMQIYLQSGELALLDLQSFDSWSGMFAEKSTNFEIDVDTSSYRLATRFARFHNLPELTTMLASIADFHSLDGVETIPEHDGHIDALIPKTVELADYLEDISGRADLVRSNLVDKKVDNMLKITTDGRKAALDLRLVDNTATFTFNSKVAQCAQNIFDIYIKYFDQKGTQLVFCDTSIPKQDFNMYDELRRLLVSYGIPDAKIAYVHDANTERQREELFQKVRSGEIRVLIGSTFKLGLGVNVQTRLVALHHLDIPWRPADMTQREGRILRQGNLNKKVYIYRYVTEGSFDAYSWQLLETKQNFISELLSGSLSERSSQDVEDTILDYAEVKALAIGNPLIKKRCEIINELTRLKTLQKRDVDTRISLEQELFELPGKNKHQMRKIEECKQDLDFVNAWNVEHPKIKEEDMTPEMKKAEKERRKVLRETIQNAVILNSHKEDETTFMTYRGFDIILPANMVLEQPYIYLKRTGKYYITLGDTEVGNLVRIDNFIDTLDKHLDTLTSFLNNLKQKREDIQNELNKKASYVDEIEKIREELEHIDKKLGVKK